MKTMNTILRLLLTLSLLTSLNLSAIEDEVSIEIESHTTTVPLLNQKALTVFCSVRDGNIEVSCHDEPSANVTVKEFRSNDEDRNKGKIDYDISKSEIRIKLYKDLKESDISLRIPCNSNLVLKCEDGDINIEGITGEITSKTIDGDLELSNIFGPVTAESVDGNIYIEIHTQINPKPMAIATIDGDISISLPQHSNIDLNASTFDGDFECELELLSQYLKHRGGSYQVNAQLNKGGSRISLKTIDGDITISKSPH